MGAPFKRTWTNDTIAKTVLYTTIPYLKAKKDSVMGSSLFTRRY